MRQAFLCVAHHQKGLKGKEKKLLYPYRIHNYQMARQNGPAIRQQSYRHLSTKSTLHISELEVSLWWRGSFEFVIKEHMERRTAASLHIAILVQLRSA